MYNVDKMENGFIDLVRSNALFSYIAHCLPSPTVQVVICDTIQMYKYVQNKRMYSIIAVILLGALMYKNTSLLLHRLGLPLHS